MKQYFYVSLILLLFYANSIYPTSGQTPQSSIDSSKRKATDLKKSKRKFLLFFRALGKDTSLTKTSIVKIDTAVLKSKRQKLVAGVRANKVKATGKSALKALKKDTAFAQLNYPGKFLGTKSDSLKTTMNSALHLSGKAAQKALKENRDAFDALKGKLPSLKQPLLKYDLKATGAFRYQPGGFGAQRLTVGMIGNVQLLGIPLNVAYSNSRTANGLSDQMASNLFKFSLDPQSFRQMLQSEWQRYDELRKTAFEGLDLTAYTQKQFLNAVEERKNEQLQKGQSVLQELAGDQAKVSRLLMLNDQAIRDELSNYRGAAFTKMKSKLSDFMRDSLQNEAKNIFDERVIANKLSAQFLSNTVETPNVPMIWLPPGIDGKRMSTYINGLIAENREKRREVIKAVSARMLKQRKLRFNSESIITDAELATLTGGQQATGLDMNKVDSLTSVIGGIKQQLQAAGFDVNRLLTIEKMDKGGGNLGTSENASNLLQRKPSGGLQGLLAHISDLKLGSFGSTLPGAVQSRDLFTSGSSMTYKAGLFSITGGYGKASDIASAKDAGWENSVNMAPRRLTYLGAEVKRGLFNKVKFAVVGASTIPGSQFQSGVPVVNSTNVAVTVSKQMNAGRAGDFTVDVSRSITSYANNYLIGNEAILDRRGGLDYRMSQDLFNATAFGLTHRLENGIAGVSDDLYFNYTGMGYQNPGNSGYNGAKLKMGGSIKRAFLQKKLTVSLRSDLNQMPISYTSNDRWKTFQLQLDGRYLLSKKFVMNLKYTANNTIKQVDKINTPVYGFQKLQADGNIRYKMGRNFSVSHFTVGTQRLATGGNNPTGSTLLTMTYNQSVMLRRNTLTGMLFYNRELTGTSLIGNMLNSEVNYQFTVARKLVLSSGVNFLDNSGIARQVGIRQGLQCQATKRLDFDLSLDARKNLIKPLYNDLYAAFRTEFMIRYHFNN